MYFVVLKRLRFFLLCRQEEVERGMYTFVFYLGKYEGEN